MRKLLVILLLLVVGYYMFDTFAKFEFGSQREGINTYFLEHTVKDLKVANTVTAIVVSYRGFDTLGEVTVLFLAATGLGSILYRSSEKHSGLNPLRQSPEASKIVTAAAKLLFPAIVILGAYVFIHGHLTPGGGFQGGSIIATGFLLMLISYRKFKVEHSIISWVESIAGLTFVSIGLLGLIYGAHHSFLENFLGTGTLNSLLSSGVIALVYIAVGFKVGAELTGILDTLVNIRETGETKEIEK